MRAILPLSVVALPLPAHALNLMLDLAGGWVVLGILGLLRPRSLRLTAHLLFPLGAAICLGVAVLSGSFLATGQAPEIMTLPLGLPSLPFHLRLDALSAFFLLLLGVAGAGISIFAAHHR